MPQDHKNPALNENQEYIEYEDRQSRRGCIALIIIILLILLLIFWPVSKERVRSTRKRTEARTHTGAGVIGQAKYKVLGGKIVYHIGDRNFFGKAKVVILNFRVKNLASQPETFDGRMVYLSDDGSRQYGPERDLTFDYYEIRNKEYFLPKRMSPGASLDVTLVFAVEKAAQKLFLNGYDFNARSLRVVTVPVPRLPEVEQPKMVPMHD